MQPGVNVGIGTTSPDQSRLEIVAGGNQLLTRGDDDQTGISHSVPLGLSASLCFNMYYANAFRYMAAGYGAQIQYSPTSGVLSFSTSQTKGVPGDVIFFNSNTVSIDSNGNLGINTTAPKARLHVNNCMVIGATAILPATGYLLSVDGKVICEELKVQLSGSWPDYVFEDGYRILNIEQLQYTVKQQKHLPGIPAALSMKNQQGYELGDMQKRLLEKLEEAYLYIFKLNEKNNNLEKRLDAIESKMAGLNK
jgi:hypothetical protein